MASLLEHLATNLSLNAPLAYTGGPIDEGAVILRPRMDNNNNSSSSRFPGDGEEGEEGGETAVVLDATNPRLVNGVIVLILLLFNIMGNSLVCYIYYFRIRPSVFSLFVTVLATLDLSTALSTMVMDVILKMRRETESTLHLLAMCKLSHFQAYGSSLAGGCVFVIIAYQRYRKICHPLKPSSNRRQARLYVAAILIVSVVLSTPTLVINGPAHVHVAVWGKVVRTTVCRYDQQYVGTPLQVGFSYLLMSAFCLMITTTVTFYILIFRALRTFERGSSLHGGGESPGSPVSSYHDRPPVMDGEGSSNVDVGVRPVGSPLPEDGGPRLSFPMSPTGRDPRPNRGWRGSAATPRKSTASRFSVITMTEGAGERVSSQMHRVFTVVTAVFVVSYVPHLAVLVLNKTLLLDQRTLTYAQRLFLELAYNCPYISTVANPLVYGFRSAEFRKHCRQALSCGDGKRKGKGRRRGKERGGRGR